MGSEQFFSEIGNTKPYLKAAFEGFAGSGKTFSSALLIMGLHQYIKTDKPIVIFDTEKASKFLNPIFKKHGIKAVVKESRSLADLKEAMKICREGYSDIMIIDSISHVYENFLEAYKKKVGRNMIQFQDWGIIKPTWKKEFSDPYVNDPYHIVMCGRAAYEYENEINQDTGKREIFKSGIKMKVEGETAYEPDVLVLMERFEEVLGKEKNVWREATIIKDRSDLIDGKTFRNPTFADFEPAIKFLLADASVMEKVEDREASHLFKTEEDKMQYRRECKIVLEEIEGILVSLYPGQTKDEKKSKVDILEDIFQTRSWLAISNLSREELNTGLIILKDKERDIKSNQDGGSQIKESPGLKKYNELKDKMADDKKKTVEHLRVLQDYTQKHGITFQDFKEPDFLFINKELETILKGK